MTPFLRKLLGLNWILLIVMLALAIFRRHRHLQRDLHARRPGGVGFLAETGAVGRGRILCVHGRESG